MPTQPMTIEGLTAYLTACKAAPPQNAIFVCGHEAPDTDAVISALVEAYRRHLVDGAPTVPILPADSLPAETAWLLGDTLTPLILREHEVAAHKARFILTDHHNILGRQVVAIVDHHPLDPAISLDGIETNIRPVGSATTLVAARCLEDELIPDAAIARLLLGAIITDTEGLSPTKTRDEDREIAERLGSIWEGDVSALFYALRKELLAERHLPTLYRRDYRRFGDLLGFAVIKVWDSTTVDEEALRALLAADREQSGTLVTLAKITRYGQENVKSETYLISAPTALVSIVADAICRAVGEAAILAAPDRVDLPANTTFLSRKRLVPILLPLLKKP